MSIQDILRAWRDHDYWLSLSESERARVPDNPAGLVELMDIELDHVTGPLHEETHGYLTCQAQAVRAGTPAGAPATRVCPRRSTSAAADDRFRSEGRRL